MPAGPEVTRGGIRDSADQLVVALPHLEAVRAGLRDLGVEGRESDRSELLGLALLELDVTAAAAPGGGSPGGAGRSVADIVRRLRTAFAEEHGGWVPTMGRNRVLDHVTGVGEIAYGGALSRGGAPGGGDGSAGEIAYGGADPTGTPAGADPAGTSGGGVEPAGEIAYGGKGSPVPPPAPARWTARAAAPGHGVRVGVLDTALYPGAWLAGGWVAPSADVLQPSSTPRSEISGHATFVTGLVLSQAPGAVVEVYRVLDDEGSADSWSVAKAIAQAGQDGLDVLNLSLVCFTEDGRPPLALATAIDRVPSTTVVVAAAGNQGDLRDTNARRPAWPAALDDVLAVGAATRAGGARAPFSPDQPWVDCVAPGVDLTSTYLDGLVAQAAGGPPVRFEGFAIWSGTSFAAALVSGAIAAGTHPGRVSSRDAWIGIRSGGAVGGNGDRAGPPSLSI